MTDSEDDLLIAKARSLVKDETFSSNALLTQALKTVQEKAKARSLFLDDADLLFAEAKTNSLESALETTQETESLNDTPVTLPEAKLGPNLSHADVMATLNSFLRKLNITPEGGEAQQLEQKPQSKTKDSWTLPNSALPPTFCPPPSIPDTLPFAKPPATGSLQSIPFVHSASYALSVEMIVEQAVLTAALLKEAWHPTRLLAQKACETKLAAIAAARTTAVASSVTFHPMSTRVINESDHQLRYPTTASSGTAEGKHSIATSATTIPSTTTTASAHNSPLPLERSFQIGLIGCGRVGSLILRALLERGVIAPTRVLVATRKSTPNLEHFKCLNVECTTDVMRVVTNCHFVILAVGPHQAPGLLSQISAEPLVLREHLEQMLERIDPPQDEGSLEDDTEEVNQAPPPIASATHLFTILQPLAESDTKDKDTNSENLTSIPPASPSAETKFKKQHSQSVLHHKPYELYRRWRSTTSLDGPTASIRRPLPFARPAYEACLRTSESTPIFFSVCAGMSIQRLKALLHSPFVMRTLVPIPHAHIGLNHLHSSSQTALRHLLVGTALPLVRKLLRLEISRILEKTSLPGFTLFAEPIRIIGGEEEATETESTSSLRMAHRANANTSNTLVDYLASQGYDALFGATDPLDLVLDRTLKVIQETYLKSGSLPLLRAFLNDPHGISPPFPMEFGTPSFATCHAVPNTFGVIGVPFT